MIYACEDTLLGRPVALKLMRHGVAPDAVLRERFFQEARTLAQLSSSHVAQLFDGGALPSGEPYMVMELLDGRDLFSVLNTEHALPEERVVSYVKDVCDGLAEAHAKGIVHRDLKPENLMLVRNPFGGESVKIVDFGVSKQLSAPAHRSMTNPSESVGSPHYMSPEQARAPCDVDVRTDIWALGVLMFELLTGRRPFDGASPGQVCLAVMTEPVTPPSTYVHGILPELEAIILRCLEKDPNQRFQTVVELKTAICEAMAPAPAHDDVHHDFHDDAPPSSVRSTTPPHQTPRARARRRPRWAVLATAATAFSLSTCHGGTESQVRSMAPSAMAASVAAR